MDNPVFACFTFYSTLLVLKMYALAIITGQLRLRRKAFANPEDAMRHGGMDHYRTNPDVERVQRNTTPYEENPIGPTPYQAHRNDMENIFPFLFLGSVYSLLEPNLLIAHIHFLVFFVGRVVHSVAYLYALKAPTRSIAYVVAQIPCVSIALQILVNVGLHW